jgi:hypothetical protein
MHEGTWNKWREAGKPDDWKIMTKVEHTKRTAEYLALVEKENPRGMRKVTRDPSQMPHIARPAVLPVAFEALPEDANVKAEGKKKRKRRKPAKVNDNNGNDADAAEGQVNQNKDDTLDAGMEDAPREAPPEVAVPGGNRKKRKRRKSGKSNSNVDDVTTDAVATADDSEPSRKRRR